MAASEGSQVLKRYQLFDIESWDEKPQKRPAGADIAADEGPSTGPKVKFSAFIASQGVTVFEDTWFILATAPDQPNPDPLHMLFAYSKGVTIASVQAHQKSFGIWGRESNSKKLLVTLGEDKVDDVSKTPKSGLKPGSLVDAVSIKIWDSGALQDGKYMSPAEYNGKEVPGKSLPRLIPLNHLMLLSNVTCADVSKDLTHIIIGLTTGNVFLIKSKAGSTLATCADDGVLCSTLTPDPGHNLPVTNIHLHETGAGNYVVYCTNEKSFYTYNLAKKGKFALVPKSEGALPHEMDAIDDNIVVLVPQAGQLRKYKGDKLDSSWPTKDKGKIRLVGKEVMFIPMGEKNKTVRVYDLENEIISSQTTVTEMYAEAVSDGKIYLLAKVGATRAAQTLREKTNIDKLECFLKKRHYDVAYKFAKNEKFSEEVLADICRYHGDFHYSKGMYKEAVEDYKNTIGYLNPSYVIQKFLDVQRLENLTEYLEALSKQSQEKETMLEEHKYYTALLLNCYVKQGGDKLKSLIASATFDKSMLDTDTAIEVCKESKQMECALMLAEKAGNIDQQLRILIDDKEKRMEALNIIDKNLSFDNKLTYLRRFGPQLVKLLPNETYIVIEKVGEELIHRRDTDKHSTAKYAQQFKYLKEIFVDNKDLNKRFLDFQVAKDPNCEKEVFHSLIEWHLQDYFNAQRGQEKLKMDLGSAAESTREIEAKRKHLIDLLLKHKDHYDQKHVLMLFEMYQVSEGVRILCEMLELKHELMTYYMQNKEYDNIEKLCEQYGEHEQNLWIQALTYFVSELGSESGRPDVQKYIKSVLEHLQNVPSISPLLVLEITSKSGAIKFSVLRDYLASQMKKLQKNIDKNRTSVQQLGKEIDDLKQNINTLRTTAQLFHLKECSECGKKLELPVLHFMCNHTFHDYCVSSTEGVDKECPKCAVQLQQIIDRKKQMLGQVENHEQFFKELKDGDNKFDVVADYFGRGLFAGISVPPPELVEDKKENE